MVLCSPDKSDKQRSLRYDNEAREKKERKIYFSFSKLASQMKTDVLRKGLQLSLVIRWIYVLEEDLEFGRPKLGYNLYF